MQLDDRLTIETPEGVDLEVTLAGLGSRAGAAFLDGLILLVVLVAVMLGTAFLGFADTSEDVAALILGVGALVATVALFGYFLLFETLNSGRTPGKAALGIRVIKVDGTPLGFGAVSIRTLLRIVDFLPTAYAVGMISLLTSSRNQRIGDLAAGTVVVRDRHQHQGPMVTPLDVSALPRWDASAVTDEELALVRRFVERRNSLAAEPRLQLAASLAGPLRVRVVAPDAPNNDEEFLVRLISEKLFRQG